MSVLKQTLLAKFDKYEEDMNTNKRLADEWMVANKQSILDTVKLALADIDNWELDGDDGNGNGNDNNGNGNGNGNDNVCIFDYKLYLSPRPGCELYEWYEETYIRENPFVNTKFVLSLLNSNIDYFGELISDFTCQCRCIFECWRSTTNEDGRWKIHLRSMSSSETRISLLTEKQRNMDQKRIRQEKEAKEREETQKRVDHRKNIKFAEKRKRRVEKYVIELFENLRSMKKINVHNGILTMKASISHYGNDLDKLLKQRVLSCIHETEFGIFKDKITWSKGNVFTVRFELSREDVDRLV